MTDVWEEWVEEQVPTREALGGNAKAVLSAQIKDLREAEKEVIRLDEELKKAKERVKNISEHVIPSTFEEMEIDDESKIVVDGFSVTIKQTIHATPKAARREEMYAWLEERGHGGLIKRKAIFDLGRMPAEEAQEWIDGIEDQRGKFERKVEPMTLKSFVKDQIEEGTEIPMDLFGAYTRRVAEVKSD